MCIKAIANYDFEAAKENVKQTIKYLDAGKLLGVASFALEVDPKAVVTKVKNSLVNEELEFAVKGKLRLLRDFLGWPVQLIQSL